MDDCKYYVYLHRRLDNGVVFYVGKGTGNRAWLNDARKSLPWKKIVSQTDYYVEIYRSGLTERQALELETSLICNPKTRWQLVNCNKNSTVKTIDYDKVSKIVSYDENSPSGLVWKQPVYRNIVGGPVGSLKLHKNGKPHKWMALIDGIQYPVHRVIYLLHNKSFDQAKLINHIDCDPSNNKIENLELVTKKENNNRTFIQVNNGLKSNNTSNYTNVYLRRGKYSISFIVKFVVNNKQKSTSFIANFVNYNHVLEQALIFRNSSKQGNT